MGGRGAGGKISRVIDYDKWGKMVDETLRDKDGTVIGRIWDEYQYDKVEDIKPITKKEILDDIDAYRNDDGKYGWGDGDVAIYVAYDDGKFVNVTELEGKAYKKKGIIGASISTPDYESVWGGEINKKTGKKEMWQTWSEDGNSGHQNSYSGYKTVSQRIVRRKRVSVKTTRKDGTIYYKPTYSTLRVSNWIDI